jgi:hypothetical protein
VFRSKISRAGFISISIVTTITGSIKLLGLVSLYLKIKMGKHTRIL